MARRSFGVGWPLITVAAVSASCTANGAPASTPVEVVPESALTVLGTHGALARVVDLQVSTEGTVWVLNETEPFFFAFAPDGGAVEVFGRRGDGPREFSQPRVLMTGTEARDVWVYELTRHALHRIGNFDDWQEVVLPRDDLPSNTLVSLDDAGILGLRPWFARSEGSFLVARSKANAYAGPDIWSADLLLLDDSGREIRTALSVGDVVEAPGDRFGPGRLFEPHPLWSRCADGTIALYDPMRNEVRRFDAAGREAEALPLPPEQAIRITPERIFDLGYRWEAANPGPGPQPDSANLRRQVEDQLAWAIDDVARVFPEYSDLHCGLPGVVWLRRVSVDEGVLGKGRSWVRVDAAEGPATFRFPDRFEPFRFVGLSAWGVLFGDFDVPHVARLELR